MKQLGGILFLCGFLLGAPASVLAQQAQQCRVEAQLVQLISQNRAVREQNVARLLVELERLQKEVETLEAEKTKDKDKETPEPEK